MGFRFTQSTVVPSAARTTSGQGAPVAVQPSGSLSLLASVTALTGTTPSLTLSVEWSNDGVVWAKADPNDGFTAVTAAGAVVKTFPVRAAVARVVWAITGTTPSVTFDVSAYGY